MNNYHIYEAVGRGKHSVVYKGRKRQTISYYAIKSVEKNQKPRVLQEVKAMHVLDNPQVLHFYAWYETTNHLWLILEYCVGGSLFALLKQDKQLPESSIHDFGRDLASSLLYLHSKGFIYCDLKPSNILLDENGRIKLGGFGLSRKLTEINRQWQSGQLLPTAKHGTPCYMAPELFMEGAMHSSKSDIWSLGCVLYEMAAGSPPFVAPTLTQLVTDILHAAPAPLDEALSPDFRDLVAQMLDKNPATRIEWEALRTHPFWKASFPQRTLPKEPALEAFYDRHQLRPSAAAGAGVRESQALAASARQSVNVMRISQIASRNLELERGEADGAEYGAQRGGARVDAEGGPAGEPGAAGAGAASVGAVKGDVALENTDAELDFVEHVEAREGEGEDDRDWGSSNATGGVDPSLSGSEASAPRAQGDAGARPQTEPARAEAGKDVGGGRDARSVGPSGTDGASTPRLGRGGRDAVGRPDSAPMMGADAAGGAGVSSSAPGVGRGAEGMEDSAGDAAPDVRMTATPLLGANPRTMQRRDTEGAEESKELVGDGGVNVRANLDSMGATKPDLLLEDVIWHPSDSVVKPIVGNRRVERVLDPKWEPASLPFRPFSLQEVLLASATTLEPFLQQIYAALASSSASADKINVLSYFESLCGDPGSANVLINSSLLPLFVRLLRSDRHDRLRVRLASVIGKLTRHATYIADAVAESGVLEVLSEVLKDKSERVRRRAMGALGELLFFCATQQHDRAQTAASSAGRPADAEVVVMGGDAGSGALAGAAAGERDVWEVPGTVLSQVVRCLRQGEDEVVQHYALKSIENIASQGGDWSVRFATQEVAFHISQIVAVTKQDALRGTASSALCRLCRANPALLPFLVDKCGTRTLVVGLTDASSKSQGASVTLLCLAAAADSLQARVRAQLLEDRTLVTGILSLLTAPPPVLQAKAVAAAGLLSRHSMGFLARLGPKFFDRLDRLSREREPYLRAAIGAFRNECAALVVSFQHQVTEELAAATRRRFLAGAGARPASSAARSALAHAAVVPAMLLCPATRRAALSPALVASVADQLELIAAPGVSFAGMAEFRAVILQTLAALQDQVDALVGPRPRTAATPGASTSASASATSSSASSASGLTTAVAEQLVPVLARLVPNEAGDSELRFAVVGLLCDLALAANWREGAGGGIGWGGVGAAGGDDVGKEASSMEHAIEEHLLPLLPLMLQGKGSEMMPLMALKVCVALMDADVKWVNSIQKLGVTPLFISFLSLDHPNNNVHNMRACRALVVGGALSCAQAEELEVISRVRDVLAYAHESSVDPFLEPVLDLICSLLERDQHAQHHGLPGAGVTASLLHSVDTLVALLRHHDTQVAVLAAEALAFLCDIFPVHAGERLLSDTLAPALQTTIRGRETGASPTGTSMRAPAAVREALLRGLSSLEPIEDERAWEAIDADALAALIETVSIAGEGEGSVGGGGGSVGGSAGSHSRLGGAAHSQAEHAALALQTILDARP